MFVFLVPWVEYSPAMAEIPQQKSHWPQHCWHDIWTVERPQKGLREEYSAFISGHELLPVPHVMEAVTTSTISLLTADVKMQKFITVNREMMEEALNALNIGAKVLAHRPNAMWDILLATEEAAKALASSVLTTKA